MMLQKVLNILTLMPKKHQNLVMAQIDFVNNSPNAVFKRIIDTMISITKNAQQREILQIYADIPVSDKDILDAFGGAAAAPLLPMTFDDTQIEYIYNNVYRNRDGKFRLIPHTTDCSPDAMPLEGLDADEDILSAKLMNKRISPAGFSETFDGLRELKRQPYDGPYDGVYRTLAANISRIKIISSFNKDEPHGFFRRNDTMYRNVCSQIINVNQQYVNEKSLRRAMFLLYLVSGATLDGWITLYKLLHFIIRVPSSATGYIIYLNDFDAGGNGKSKFVSLLQTIFGDAFTAFSPQQLRFTISLMGKRLVSISEYEDNETSKPLQGLLKSMTGRDRFQYEGKGTNPIVAETYQNFIISSNRYIYFEDSGIKRRLQNFHCSNLLHIMLNKYCKTHDYLNPLFGNVFNGESQRLMLEMANSLLDYILKDDNAYSIPVRPQGIVLGSLRNPVLRTLFMPSLQFDGFIRETKSGSAIDLFRLANDAKPEQLNYAASMLQNWFSDVSFDVARDCTTMTCNLPGPILIARVQQRLSELDELSRVLKARNKVQLECGQFKKFDSADLFKEFLGQACTTFKIPVTKIASSLVVGA